MTVILAKIRAIRVFLFYGKKNEPGGAHHAN